MTEKHMEQGLDNHLRPDEVGLLKAALDEAYACIRDLSACNDEVWLIEQSGKIDEACEKHSATIETARARG